VYLDIASRRSAEEIRKKLPSMYHQFSELADVDITKEPMEVGPTCHYVMGGIEVDPDDGSSAVPGLFAAGECSGGMHGSNRLGGNSLSDLLVFGRRAGLGAVAYLDGSRTTPAIDEADVESAATAALAPFDGAGDNPYSLHSELQQMMNDLVGIIREEGEMEQALKRLDDLEDRAKHVAVEGHRQFNPGWHLALDLENMLLVSRCVAGSALLRTESRGGHTRDDHPAMSSDWRKRLLVCSLDPEVHGGVRVDDVEQPAVRADLLALFEWSELSKYFTPEELDVAEISRQKGI
jgi:succinate dehydrogenase / fumarate reductase flavoprotein subunit